jgi:hypothetical protein
LYLLNGLSPSPQIKMKFKSQVEDPINGSDICHRIFGKNAEKRHKHFKASFSCQDPMLSTPPRKMHPNHKIDNPLSHVSKFLFLMQNFTVLTRRAAGCYLHTGPNSRKPAVVLCWTVVHSLFFSPVIKFPV